LVICLDGLQSNETLHGYRSIGRSDLLTWHHAIIVHPPRSKN
jgi:hypothetical protein